MVQAESVRFEELGQSAEFLGVGADAASMC